MEIVGISGGIQSPTVFLALTSGIGTARLPKIHGIHGHILLCVVVKTVGYFANTLFSELLMQIRFTNFASRAILVPTICVQGAP